MINPSLLKYEGTSGYFAIAVNNHGIWKEKFFNDIEKANEYIEQNKHLDCYSSVATFRSARRNGFNIDQIHEFFVDIDRHTEQQGNNEQLALFEPLTESKAREFNENVLQELYDVAIPTPTQINFTGRGLQLHYKIKGTRDFIKWQYIENALIQTFDNICKKEDAFISAKGLKGLEVDFKTSDKTRVLRNANTLNTKVNKMCTTLQNDKKEYTLEDILAFNLAYTTGKGKKKKEHHLNDLVEVSKEKIVRATNKELKKFKLYNPNYTQETINHERLQDLFKLIELRNGQQYNEGYRNELMGIVAQILNKSTNTKQELFIALQDFNNAFNVPLRTCEVKAWVNSSVSHSYYNFTNTYIIEKLGITEQEQEQLSIILTKKMKNKKYYLANGERIRTNRNKRYAPVKAINQTNKTLLKAQAKQLREQGHKYKEIAKELNISLITAKRYVK